jgi:import receptor subunit TOM20
VYLAWFDYHRRHNSDYRREIRRSERRHEREIREETERHQREDYEALRQIVQAIGREPLPTNMAERQEYMLMQLEEGQRCIDAGRDERKAASYFYRALMVASDKGSIATVYNEKLPKVSMGVFPRQRDGRMDGC